MINVVTLSVYIKILNKPEIILKFLFGVWQKRAKINLLGHTVAYLTLCFSESDIVDVDLFAAVGVGVGAHVVVLVIAVVVSLWMQL